MFMDVAKTSHFSNHSKDKSQKLKCATAFEEKEGSLSEHSTASA